MQLTLTYFAKVLSEYQWVFDLFHPKKSYHGTLFKDGAV